MMFITMPELPEVETLRRELSRALVGRVIKSIKVLWPKSVAPKNFAAELRGVKILSLERRAKILLLDLVGGQTLAIHLKMTGQLIYQPQGLSLAGFKDSPFHYTCVILNFTDGSRLYFNDLRKFGWLRLLEPKAVSNLHQRHGLEPLSSRFTIQTFRAILNRYPKRKLKTLLLDQTLIAGLGNIYVDESCFAAGIRPARRSRTLTLLEIKKLHRAIKKILRLAIKKGGTSARDYVRSDGRSGGFAAYLKVYGRAKQKCKRCRTGVIQKIKLAGRGTHFCPQCQK